MASISKPIDLIPVDKRELLLEYPLPYDLYDREGNLLMREGEILTPSKNRNLFADSWRQRPTQPIYQPESTPLTESAERPRLPPITKPESFRQPLTDAKVLVVEDMKLSQKLLTNMLNQQRIFNIETADDGLSAIKKFKTHRFDLVFLDIDMPIMDGLSVLAEIRTRAPSVFVCFVSGSGTLANVIKAKELCVNAFLAKPINGLGIERILRMYEKECRHPNQQ